MMNNVVQKNKDIWEDIYSSGGSNLMYPNEMLVRVFNKYKGVKGSQKVLDFGFGTGANMIHFLENGCLTYGAETSQSAIEIVMEKLDRRDLKAELELIDGKKLPYEDNFFDLVVAWQVLEYNDLDSFNSIMNEINRVLKKGGIFIGTMTAIGDQTYKSSEKIGKFLYESRINEQVGATCIIVDKGDMKELFPEKELSIGEYFYDFQGIQSRHWIVVYEN